MKTAITRAWTDIEPKVLAWIAAGGLLTAATIVYGYVEPHSTLPLWVAPVVTYAGGLITAYLKKSTVQTSALVPGDGLASPANTAATNPAALTPGPDHKA